MQTKSGKPLHPIGIGTWLIAGTFEFDPTALYKGAEPAYGNEPQEIAAIKYSLSKGQNHIDCAELYGGFYTDEVVGRALAGATAAGHRPDQLGKLTADLPRISRSSTRGAGLGPCA